MSYIDKNLLPDERILFRTKKSLIVFSNPIILTILSILATNYMHSNTILYKLEWAPWLVTLIYWAYVWIEYVYSDFAVTNKRVMMREGFFNRHTNELRLTTISQVNVDQSIIGQILNYGEVSLNAFGAFDTYSLIAKPFEFQKSINQQMDTLTKTPG